MRFVDKCVVVTGAASGIGRATALLFNQEGAKVFAADINVDGVEALAREAPGLTPVACDVSEVSQIKETMDQAASAHGGIDVVFNNAGAGGSRKPIDEIDADDWDGTMNVLLRSVAMGTRYAAPHMKHRQGASIVNTASVAALLTGGGPIAYSTAKAGVQHLTRCAAADLARYGIRVNAVLPGLINTNIFAPGLEAIGHLDERAKAVLMQVSAKAQPIARPGMPLDIAKAVAFLASEDAGFITGASLVVDGGITLGPRHSWDPKTPGLIENLIAMSEAAS